MNKKLTIFLIPIILIGLVLFAYFCNKDENYFESYGYYDDLVEECRRKEDYECCLRSLEIMAKEGYRLIPSGGCLGRQNSLECADSLQWCEKEKERSDDVVFDEYGFSLSLPMGWQVEVEEIEMFEEVESRKNTFSFRFKPPEGSSFGFMWGGFDVSVVDFQGNIEEFIQYGNGDHYSSDINFVGRRRESIDGKPTYFVEPREPIDEMWRGSRVVLGSNYAYVFRFPQDGASGFAGRLKAKIYPRIKIE